MTLREQFEKEIAKELHNDYQYSLWLEQKLTSKREYQRFEAAKAADFSFEDAQKAFELNQPSKKVTIGAVIRYRVKMKLIEADALLGALEDK
jgi:hypothetical protein